MPATGPGDKPNRPRRRSSRPSRAQVQQATQNARPLSARPVRPKPVPKPVSQRQARQTQQRAQNARPLSSKPTKPKQVVRPLAQKPPRRVTTAEPSRLDVHTDVRTAQRQAAVHVYDQLSHKDKRARVAEAHQNVKAGKASESDRAILHIHNTRVAGKQKIAAATRAFDALSPNTTARKLAFPAVRWLHGGIAAPAGSKAAEYDVMHPPKPFRKATGGTVANLPSVGKVVKVLAPAASVGLDKTPLPKVIKNIPKDAAEIAVTSPSSVAKTLVTAVHHPEQAGKALVQPYKQLAKDPKKFITEHPVETALMVQPAARLPGRAVGKLARVAGKQSLERAPATLEHTAMREARPAARGAMRRAVQARRDARTPAPQITAHQINRRVDEAFAAAEKHGERVQNAIMRESRDHAKTLPKAQRAQEHEDARVVARGVAKNQARRSFAREFGATARVENGRVVEQPNVTHGHLHNSPEDARLVAEHLNAKAQTIQRGHGNVLSGDPVGRLYAKEQVPVTYKVIDAGIGKHAVVPEQIAERLDHHRAVGSSRATGAKLLRQSRGMFTRAVLPYRPTWLSGQGVEGAVRSAVAGAGPTSLLRAARLAKRQPDVYKQVAERAVPGGIVGRASLELTRKTLHEEFPESNVARALTELGRTPGIKQVRQLHTAATQFVFNHVNARFLEAIPQTTMLGKALKDSPLMERSIVGLSNKAIDDAAKGLTDTHNISQLAREIQRSYGKYSAFSPKMRELITHWTPFLPWYINTAHFLVSVLPKDHPLAAALVADMTAAQEDWRKQQGLSVRYRNKNSLPAFMLGGYPTKGRKNIVRIGHYTPSGIGTDLTGAVSGLPLPQFSGAYNALLGIDWKGEQLKHPDGSPFNEGEKFVYGLTQLGEALVPLAGQVQQVAGAQDKKAELKKLARPISSTPLRAQRKPKSGRRTRGRKPTANPLLKRSVTGGNPLLKRG